MEDTIYRQTLTLPKDHEAARDVGRLHALVQSGYSYVSPREGENRVGVRSLFYAKRAPVRGSGQYPLPGGRAVQVVVQATMPGEWDVPFTQAKPVRYDFTVGDLVEVEVEVNPVRSVSSGVRGVRGRKVVIRDRAEVARWFARQAERGGFMVDPTCVSVGEPQRVFGVRSPRHGSAGFHVDSRTVRAVGEVADTELFTRFLVDGVGRARAYGAGLVFHRKVSA